MTGTGTKGGNREKQDKRKTREGGWTKSTAALIGRWRQTTDTRRAHHSIQQWFLQVARPRNLRAPAVGLRHHIARTASTCVDRDVRCDPQWRVRKRGCSKGALVGVVRSASGRLLGSDGSCRRAEALATTSGVGLILGRGQERCHRSSGVPLWRGRAAVQGQSRR